MNVRKYLPLLVALLLPWPAYAVPELNVGALYDYLEPTSSTLVKRVRNGGDSTAFVKVSVAELVYGENGIAREIDLEGVPLSERGLVVSPARLIVPARGMQAMRVLYRGERDRERYFRLRFIPVLPEQGDGFAVSAEEAKAYGDSLKAGVQLLAGFGTLLFVRPAETHYQTRTEGQGGKLTVENQGNSTVVLDHFRVCTAAGGQCRPATKHHLPPGRTREFEGGPGQVFEFELHEGKQHRQVAVQG